MEPRPRRTTAPRTIRRWVEARGGYPAELAEPHGDEPAGALRIVLPDAPPAPVRPLDWPTFFERLAAQQLALVYWDTPAGGAGARLERRAQRARAAPAQAPRMPPERAATARVARAGRARGTPRRPPRVSEPPPPPAPGSQTVSPEPRAPARATTQRPEAARTRPVLRRAAVAVLVGALRLGHRLSALRRTPARRRTPAV